jgi:ActR/RegA family two-component response regulator/GGDEF domain-containing protein
LTARLSILAIVEPKPLAELFSRVFTPTDDRVTVAASLADGLSLAAAQPPDLAFVDVSLGHNAGLALVHHLRAVAPTAMIYALANESSLHIGAQAVALGGSGLIMMPPSGDELLSAAAEARARLAAAQERQKLEERAEFAHRVAESAGKVAGLAECGDRREAARRLAQIFAEMSGAANALVYLPASEGSTELSQSGAFGKMPNAPTFTDEMGLVTFARQSSCEVVPLSVRHLAEGHVLLSGLPSVWGPAERSSCELMASQAATTLALLGERERSTRGAIKDLTTSAYTFAYFVDIAGREIDKARRYGRRFALATIALDDEPTKGSPDPFAVTRKAGGGVQNASTDLAEVILSVVRDTDVLARVDEREFYLLMPETGGVGAQSCRRRVLQSAAARAGQPGTWGVPPELTIGVATYPHDGTDLSRLLRAAKRRAEMSKRSIVRNIGHGGRSLSSLIDDLMKQGASSSSDPDFEGARPIELSLRDAIDLAISAVSEAMRGGPTFVAVAHHPELGLSSSVRAHLGHEREGLALHILDLRNAEGCEDLQVLTVIAEHGAYLLVGRSDGVGMRGVHGSDPILVDLITLRSGQTAGVRLLD